MIKTTVCIRN